jgi:hypothetical protein
MDDSWLRIIDKMGDRVSGPLKFRLLLQPVMAATFAIKAGQLDARIGKPPNFWALAPHREHRGDMLKDGWRDVGKVFVSAVVLDVAYQFVVLRFVYPGGVILVAFTLAILPCLILRGLVTRITRRREGRVGGIQWRA